ncbi:MAG: chromosomal replication initiator protein DnaA [Caldisericia bacterium]|nr:chromosomal replication initiator protein DnaA [Caldisericia bacterium]
MKNDYSEKLEIILNDLKKELTPTTFLLLKKTKIVSVSPPIIEISVISEFVKVKIREALIPLLLLVVRKQFPLVESIVIHVDQEKRVVLNEKESSGESKHQSIQQNIFLKKKKIDSLPLNPRYTFANFIVGGNNQLAYAGCKSITSDLGKIYNPLFIYGGVGLGKTHLLQAIAHECHKNGYKNIIYTTSERFTNQLIHAIQTKNVEEFRDSYREVDYLIIDDIQFLIGKEKTQEELFHTFNTLYDQKKQIAISSDRPQNELKGIQERLISRFSMGLTVDIYPPDYETRFAILRNKDTAEQYNLPDEVLDFIASQKFSNIRQLEGSLIRVASYASMQGINDVTIEFAKETLKNFLPITYKKFTPDEIKTIVCEFYHIKPQMMESKKRSKDISMPRQVAIYLIREMTDYSLPVIGRYFGGRDHSTIIHSYEKIKNEIKTNLILKSDVENITKKLQYT